ncbi:mannose-ethanolamine phosphotransferase gpi13, partial [Thoreauomyces humboldtii]
IPFGANSSSQGCWHPRRYERAVLIVLDALRFDFALYDEKLAEEAASSGGNSTLPFYINKLPIMHDLLRDQPASSLLLRVRADPPTTTLQRLKALTTGTLPTFVDAGSNFLGQVIAEDNLIDQLTRNGKRIAFMGDDTWMLMYPDAMTESHAYPSLEVWDIHTVDNGVLDHLRPTLQRKDGSWDLLIAHFLGVDHAGHRYGPAHAAMADKLTQMNGVLADVIEDLDDDTVLFVIGDHGMDSKGDHGGDSENEVNAALFMYSKKPLFETSPEQRAELEDLLAAESQLELETSDPFVYMLGHRTTPQIDFVPTIAMLLGIPIPFGNLGTVIPEVFFTADNGDSPAWNLLKAVRTNALQIQTYIKEYSAQRMAAKLAITDLDELFTRAEAHFKEAARDPTLIKTAYLEYMKYNRRTLVAARKMWARFDNTLIVLGGLVLLLTFASMLTYIAVHVGVLAPSPPYWIMAVGTLVGSGLARAGVLARLLAIVEDTGDSALGPVHELVFGSAFGLTVSYLLAMWVENTSQARIVALPTPKVAFVLVLYLIHTVVPASDNLTLGEDNLTTWLLYAFGMVNFVGSYLMVKGNETRDRLVTLSLAFVALTYISSLSIICREEQESYCLSTLYSTPYSTVSAPYTICLLFLMIPVICLGLRQVLRSSENDRGMGFTLPQILLPVGLATGALYWGLDTLDNHHVMSDARVNFGDIKFWWARVALFSVSFACSFIWFSGPNCVGIDIVTTTPNIKAIPQLSEVPTQASKKLCIFGVANAIGSSYLVFLSVTYMIVVMLSKPLGGAVLGGGFLQILCLLEMLHLWRDKAAAPDATVENPRKSRLPAFLSRRRSAATTQSLASERPARPLSVAEHDRRTAGWTIFFLVPVYLLGARYFFATGHQNTLTSIQWDMGYIGMKHLNWTFSPLLVLINTLAGPILFGLAAPLFAVWKRPVVSGTEDRTGREVAFAVVAYLSMTCGSTVVATLLAGHFRRHLMVWRVFAPKFFFSALTLVTVDLALLVFGVPALAVTYSSFSKYLTGLRKLGISK